MAIYLEPGRPTVCQAVISCERTSRWRESSHSHAPIGPGAHKRGAGFVWLAAMQLQASPLWVTMWMYPTASEGRRCILGMPFYVFAALAVLGTLALVGVLYLLARRWL